jgi:pilus assembly protein CpaE
MFDLVDLLQHQQTQKSVRNPMTSVLFYQTAQCKDLVVESYRFEGLTPPFVAKNSDLAITGYVREQHVEIVIVELNNSRNVMEDARRISHLLPGTASVIIVGCEDAISTIRNLKSMGFYYLFWPVTKQELNDFIRNVSKNRRRHTGPGELRRAKRIAIVGSKGGVGTSLLTAELAHLLTQEKRSSCVVVDHNYYCGNLDIMLGMRKFEKRPIQKGAFSHNLDLPSAQNLLTEAAERLSVLALTSTEMNQHELREYLSIVTDLIAPEYNFIVEDVSASTGLSYAMQETWIKSDCIIFVTAPTVSSVRDIGRMKASFDKFPEPGMARILFVVNHVQPEKYATVTQADIGKFIGCPPDLVIPFYGDVSRALLEGKRIYGTRTKASPALRRLASLVVGENISPHRQSFFRQWTSKGSWK